MSKELVINDKLTNKICTELMNGIPLARLARQKDMPSLTRIYKEITNNKSFLERINEARRIGAQTYIENAMDELEHADNRNIMIVREKVGLAKWLSKNKSMLGELKIKNPIAYTTFMEDFKSLKTNLQTKGVL